MRGMLVPVLIFGTFLVFSSFALHFDVLDLVSVFIFSAFAGASLHLYYKFRSLQKKISKLEILLQEVGNIKLEIRQNFEENQIKLLEEHKLRSEAIEKTRADLAQMLTRTDNELQEEYRSLISKLEMDLEKRQVVNNKRVLADTYSISSSISYLNTQVYPKSLTLEAGWAASAEFLAELHATIISKKPKFIFEIGSGVSTVIQGVALRQLGSGKSFSLEHLSEFQEKTKEQLEEFGVQDFCEVQVRDLVDHNLEAGIFRWYDLKDLPTLPIDILVVDGPPGGTQKMARYPVLELLSAQITQETVIFLDDFERPDEQAAVEKWKELFPNLRENVFGSCNSTKLVKISFS